MSTSTVFIPATAIVWFYKLNTITHNLRFGCGGGSVVIRCFKYLKIELEKCYTCSISLRFNFVI